jgi:4a-hydroxytetrahydrobiopterin dehydratase
MNLADKTCIACRKGAKPLATDKAKALLKHLSRWSISEDGVWLLKAFKFKNFAQALAFANQVGEIAEAQNHHPDIMLGWGYVNVRLQTHAAGGLHENDFIVAAKIDAL